MPLMRKKPAMVAERKMRITRSGHISVRMPEVTNESINPMEAAACWWQGKGKREEGKGRESNPIQFGALDSEARLCRQPEEEEEAAIFLCAERRKRVYFIVERGARTGLTRSIQSTSSTSVEAVLRLRKQ
jgi:hypothetical protein